MRQWSILATIDARLLVNRDLRDVHVQITAPVASAVAKFNQTFGAHWDTSYSIEFHRVQDKAVTRGFARYFVPCVLFHSRKINSV